MHLAADGWVDGRALKESRVRTESFGHERGGAEAVREERRDELRPESQQTEAQERVVLETHTRTWGLYMCTYLHVSLGSRR